MKKLFLLCVLMVAAPVYAVEELTLTTPVTKPSVVKWQLLRLTIDRAAQQIITVFLEPTTGETVTCTETGDVAAGVISTLNTANLTTNSLQKRAITRAQTTGCLGAGTVAGTAD